MPEIAASVELDGQYRALREGVGVLERPGRGELTVRGSQATDYLQGQLTNDLEALAPGEGCYAALLDRKGHMRADLRALRIADDHVWLDTEGIAAPALLRHLETYRIGRDVEIADVSAEHEVISLIGPGAAEVSGAGPLSPEHAHREIELAGASCRAVATDLGIDLIAPASEAGEVLRFLLDAGAGDVSEAAAEILRVEAGRPRFGYEMTEATIPAEAGINERAVSFTKGCYIGQETVARLHYRGKPNRHLRGLRLEAPAADGDAIRHGEREVGSVGTACVSPTLGPIALAIVRREAAPGERVTVGAAETPAEVLALPFR
jgi:tRNA-modifying protein YgfZ